MLDEDLHHDVLELDVHDGGHRLLLWAEQRGPEDHAQVGHCHQVALVMAGHAVGHGGTRRRGQQRVKVALRPANSSLSV